MNITWLGHSSFLIEDSKGRKILTDPFNETVGYKLFEGEVDLISISHHHFDHDYTSKVTGNPKIIDKSGLFNLCDIPIEGIPSFHDNEKGAKRGENIIFILEIDGYRICHLGDLGHKLSKDTLDKIGNVDILLIPVGGNYTIDGKAAADIAKVINSKIIIPMHYKTPSLAFPLDGVETFITCMGDVEKINSSTLNVNGTIDSINKVKILNAQNEKE